MFLGHFINEQLPEIAKETRNTYIGETTPCLKKTVNNSVKHWPTLIIFGMQHQEET